MVKIACLPVAGTENPYQYLMIEGLNNDKRLKAFNGSGGKIFSAVRTCLKHKPEFIHYDWIERYFVRNPNWLTFFHGPIFVLEIILLKKYSIVKLYGHYIIYIDMMARAPLLSNGF